MMSKSLLVDVKHEMVLVGVFFYFNLLLLLSYKNKFLNRKIKRKQIMMWLSLIELQENENHESRKWVKLSPPREVAPALISVRRGHQSPDIRFKS